MTPDCSSRRFGIVAARFYADLAEEMVAGAMDALRECNVAPEDITVYDVPGCFELPARLPQSHQHRSLRRTRGAGRRDPR